MTFEPDPDKMRHYLPGRRPYVEIVMNERKIHARVMAWQGDRILVEYPATMISKYTHGQRETLWIHKSEAKRIRREDSIWADLEDDYTWHHGQDEKNAYRPDPWTIYGQNFPDSK
ncbi:hypothetical protein AA310_00140 [Arthrobacter sp. YC-RL1]|nr:hypothetical protein ATC04_18455 [Arthrobacter sp. YC-RL1]KLI90708.1 hypothetical protein AA310_00140 [Arthrobacter sp. YC-RL1]